MHAKKLRIALLEKLNIFIFVFNNSVRLERPPITYEVIDRMVSIKVDEEKCTGCGTCVDTCPVGVYELKELKGKKAIPTNVDQCLICRACEVQCPSNAINVTE